VAVAAQDAYTAPGFIEAPQAPPPDADTRRYTLRQAKQRLHQGRFRTAVLQAYGQRCALSGLPETRLLDAAHIVPDADLDLGQPIIPNGLAMSRLHHAAYDAGLLGIDPTGRIHVSRALLAQQDGPILHALQALDGQRLRSPADPRHTPDPARLEQRFAIFEAT
jgi:putative restriction endonuclease